MFVELSVIFRRRLLVERLMKCQMVLLIRSR
jgi:hypothetical protein